MSPLGLIQNVLKSYESWLSNAFGISSNELIFGEMWFFKDEHFSADMCPLQLILKTLESDDTQLSKTLKISSHGLILVEIWSV